MVVQTVLIISCFFDILLTTAKIQISPSPVAYVSENQSLTLTCTVTDLSYNFLRWKREDDVVTREIYRANNNCVDYNGIINATLYQFTCTGNMFTWKILHVTRQQHGDKWYCEVDGGGGIESNRIRVFVRVPVTSVVFTSPVGTSVPVTENMQEDFVCTTSVERPRSVVMWYITGNRMSLGIGTNIPSDDDNLSSTTSSIRLRFNRTSSGQQLFCKAFNIVEQTPKESNRKNLSVNYGTDGPPVIDGFTNGSRYRAILSQQQSLVCTVSGGNPAPSLTWNCFSGNAKTESGRPGEVRTRIKWTPNNKESSTCKCMSNQTVSGEQVFTLSVDVHYPPSTPVLSVSGRTVSGTVKVIQGKSIVVKCQTTSNPASTYTWSNNVNGQNLRFDSVNLSDEKSYTCNVTNTMEPSLGNNVVTSNNTNFALNVLFPPSPPALKVGTHNLSGELSIVKGDSTQVICESTSDPGPPTYKWTGQSSGSAILQVHNIPSTVSKTCTATNTMTPTEGAGTAETKSKSATLNIIVMKGPTTPTLSYRSTTGSTTNLTRDQLRVIKGTDFSLVCSGSTSIPAPSYRWSGKVSSNNNTTTFNNIDTVDNGQHTCIVENTMKRTVGTTAYGNNSNHVVIEILTTPEIDPLQDLTIIENQPLTVQCTATANPMPTSYTWTRSKGNFNQTQSTMTIPNTRRGDADVYNCTARNDMDPTVGGNTYGIGSRTMNVRILYHPDVTVSPLNGTTLNETATNVMVLCSAMGEPQEYNFSKWVQYAPDGLTKVKEYESSHINDGNAYLTFESVSYMNSGIYHCFVRNGIEDYKTGNIVATNSTSQIVKGKPVAIGGEHDVATAKHENSSLWIDFYSNDGNNPSVKWFKINGEEKHNLENQNGKIHLEMSGVMVDVNYYGIAVPHHGNRTQLLLQNISDSDFGGYEVEIQNSIGYTRWNFNLVAQGAPDIPKQFKIISATETSIVLSWRSGFHGGANQTFYIQYTTSTSAWQNSTESVDGGLQTDTDFNDTVPNLKSGTAYTFRMFAANKFDRSDFTTEIEALTIKAKEPNGEGDSLIGPAVGGGVGGALAIVAVVVLVVIIRRRGHGGGEKGTQKKILLDGKRSENGVQRNDDLEEVANPMYEPAGAFQSTSNATQNDGIKNEQLEGLYAKPQKKNGASNEPPGGDLYSLPVKNRGDKTETPTDIYSIPQKGKGKQKKQKNVKEKKQKQKKNKDNLQGNINEGMVYENADLGAGAMGAENIYEMTNTPEPPKPSRTQNADGLIYLEVDVSRNKDATGHNQVIIHGVEDRSDYADIAFGKVGEPAPESDEEKDKENTNEG